MRYLVGFLRICGLVLIAFIGCLGGGDEGCEFDKCEGVVCPPDDNECTREGCSNATGSCTSWPVEDGTACTYDGLSGVCVEGVCGEDPCEGVVCDDNDACTEDACGYPDGTCEFTPVVCNDYEECTEDTCDPADGCVFTAVEDGTSCGGSYVCVAGECVWPECRRPEDCDDGNECTEDTCDLVEGCVFTAVEDGTSCNLKGFAGVCIGGVCDLCEGVVCDDAHECTVGDCNPATGTCDYTPVEDGTLCTDGLCIDGECGPVGSVFPCTEQGIRAAIATGGGPYTFSCEGLTTIVTNAEIVVDNDVILDGEGNLTITASYSHRVVSIASGVTAELRRLKVSHGSGELGAGGIHNAGDLTVTSSTVHGNVGDQGGGIFSLGTLTVIDSTLSGNIAYHGGGIFSRGTLTVINSTVSGNAATAHAGGVYVTTGGDGTLTNSTVSGNTTNIGYGGGIVAGGILTMTNSTVSGNSAARGGGIYNTGDLTLTNTVADGGCYIDTGATTYSGGYNIESPGDTCGFDPDGTDQVNVSAEALNLGELADNGGPTQTHALLTDPVVSAAIDQIPADMCEVDTDQRGEPRPETGGDACDVGALEVQP